MRNYIIWLLALFLFVSYLQGQTQQDSISTTQQTEQQVPKVQQLEIPIYKLFSTQNMWTFIKLDTRNGKMWQVQYTVNTKDHERFESTLNSSSLLYSWEEEINGRFTLYPTTNTYNFILLDQINGRTYQVQWSINRNERLVIPIY